MSDKPEDKNSEEPQDQAEEEVIMGGSDEDAPSTVHSSSSSTEDTDQEGVFNAASIDVSDKIKKDTASATDLLDQVLNIDEDEFIPWEDITLPSHGAYYKGGIPNGIVRVKAMGIHAEKILATQRLAQSGQSIDYLFRRCVQFPKVDGKEVDPADLLAGDRIFLLYVLRGITHGNIYEFMLKCPSCDAT
ncbi:MAG: hypothetical protein V3T31_12265, partial [candidate division Zixibacteria bacterium]